MALGNCDECGGKISTRSDKCVHCGAPVSDKIRDMGARLDNNREVTIASYTYSMFRAGPLWLIIFIATSFVGIGILPLVSWFVLMLPRPRLTITDRRVIYRDMQLKKTIVDLVDIEAITTGASPFQKLIGSGWIVIHRKGLLNFNITFNGLPDPKQIKKYILKYKI